MGAQKQPENGLQPPKKGQKYNSSPPLGTINDLINSKLRQSVDKILTNSLNYKRPEIYDGDGDLSKKWFVYYSFINPETGKFERFKVFRDINSYKLKSERMEAAKAIQRAYLELLEEGFSPYQKYRVGPNFNIVKCIHLYLDEKEKAVKINTLRKYNQLLKVFEAWLNEHKFTDLSISEITLAHCKDFLDSKHWGNKTYNNRLLDLKTFFNYFLDNFEDALPKSPIAKLKKKTVHLKGNMAFKDLELTKLKEYLSEKEPYLYKFCQFVYYTGLRPQSEARFMKCEYFDFTYNRIVVPAEISKNKKTQYIPLDPALKDLLIEMGAHKASVGDYVFSHLQQPGPQNLSQEYTQNRFKKAKSELKLNPEHTIYSFKHTRAIHLYLDTKDPILIKDLFRHASLDMTIVYLKDLGLFIDDQRLLSARRM